MAPSHDDIPDDSTPPPEPESDDGLSMDAEFLRLTAELDDIPGFRDYRAATAPAPPPAAGPRDWPTSAEVEALEDKQSHFVPPDPGLDLSGDPIRVAGWFLVCGGVLGLLLGVILGTLLPSLVLPLSGVAVLVGAGLLLWRMPHGGKDHQPPPGDGAVI